MTNIKSRILSFILVLAMVLSFVAFDVFAADVVTEVTGDEGNTNGAPSTPDVDTDAVTVVGKDGETFGFDTLSKAMSFGYSGGIEKIVVNRDITEAMSKLEGNIVCGNPNGVTITNTIVDEWIYCDGTNFTIGEGITYKAVDYGSGLFVYGDDCVINGTVIVDAYYQRYADSKLTINAPGSLTVKTETFVVRYMDGDAEAGIYINGDGNDETVELNAAVIYFYQGMINAKDATIKVGTYWQTNETDCQGSANLVLDNSTLNVTVNEHDFKATGNSTVTVKNGSSINAAGGFKTGDDTKVIVDSTSSVIDKNGKVETPVYVASVNGEGYLSIQEAIKAAAPNGTVEILNDVTVDKWIMFAEHLSISNGNLITLNINGLTINGNNHTLTINSIESAGNGGRLFYDAENLNINDLTIKYADGLVGGIGLQSGTISKVTFDGGKYGVLPGSNGVAIKECTFKSEFGIYYETARENVTVEDNIFNCTNYSIYLRGNETFSGNTVNTGKVNVVSGSPVVTGNDFGEERFKVYNGATATITGNTINNLVFNDETATKSTFSSNTLSEDAQDALEAVEIPTEGYYLTIYNADGTVGMIIDGTKSASDFSLKSAIEDARVFADNAFLFGITTPATYEIEMFEDSIENKSFTIDSDVTINGNGHKIVLAEGVEVTVNATMNDVEIEKPVVNYVAQIGDTYYETLADAIAAAKAGETITLLADVTEDVTIGKSLTIDGGNFKYTGNISVEGSASSTSVTVKNVNFVDGTGYAITTNRIESITVENCTVKNYGYGFLYANKSTPTVAVKNVTVENCNYGFHWVYGTSATLENVKMTDVVYGLFIQNYAAKTITLKNCNISSIEIWERAGYSGNQTFKFEGDNTVTTLSSSQYAKYVLAAADVTLKAADGFTVTTTVENYMVEYANGVYTVVKALAKNNETGTIYKSLQDAVDAAQAGDTIVLLADIALTEGVTVPAGKTITLDLNGKTISGVCNKNEGLITVENTAKLTIKDSSEDSTGKITYAAGASKVGYTLHVKGNLVLESGTIEMTGTWSNGFAVDVRPNSWGTEYTEGTTFVMNGGKIVSSDSAVRVASSSDASHKNVSASFTMNGGVIESEWDAIFIQHWVGCDFTVEITDGKVTGTNSALRIYGDTAVNKIDLTVSGGTFTGEIKNLGFTGEGETAISGGTFSSDVSEYCVDFYTATKNEDGTYGVAKVPDGYVKAYNPATGEYKYVENVWFEAKNSFMIPQTDDMSTTTFRFTYAFDKSLTVEDFWENAEWGWRYWTEGNEDDVHITYSNTITTTNLTSLRFNNVKAEYFNTNAYVQLFFNVTIDGVEYTIYDEVRAESAASIAQKYIDKGEEEVGADAVAYAEKVIAEAEKQA